MKLQCTVGTIYFSTTNLPFVLIFSQFNFSASFETFTLNNTGHTASLLGVAIETLKTDNVAEMSEDSQSSDLFITALITIYGKLSV